MIRETSVAVAAAAKQYLVINPSNEAFLPKSFSLHLSPHVCIPYGSLHQTHNTSFAVFGKYFYY